VDQLYKTWPLLVFPLAYSLLSLILGYAAIKICTLNSPPFANLTFADAMILKMHSMYGICTAVHDTIVRCIFGFYQRWKHALHTDPIYRTQFCRKTLLQYR
jgi:hypothetical protein